MKVKTSEAKGRVLNWLVAQAEGAKGLRLHTYRTLEPVPPVWVVDWERDWIELSSLDYCNDWGVGGPIIDREDIDVLRDTETAFGARLSYASKHPQRDVMSYFVQRGPTKLIAAMRCFVASKLGEEVEVPEELL